MCETTRAIERHPCSLRRLLEIRIRCERMLKRLRELVEEDDGTAERHA